MSVAEGNIHFEIYTLVLDIFCQQLGDICQLEGVCVHFGRRVGEYAFCNILICILYIYIYTANDCTFSNTYSICIMQCFLDKILFLCVYFFFDLTHINICFDIRTLSGNVRKWPGNGQEKSGNGPRCSGNSLRWSENVPRWSGNVKKCQVMV